MIKLMDLLLEVKLSPEEQEQYKQALAILQSDTLDEGVMDKLKKLGLSATVIAALLASPQLTQAQKSPLEDLSKQTTSTVRIGTEVDGIVGQYTSEYRLPVQATDTLIRLEKDGGKVKETSREVTYKDNLAFVKDMGEKYGISLQQMIQWNNFQQWLQDNKYAGSPKMNDPIYSKKVTLQYKKLNPSFFITYNKDNKSPEVESIQSMSQEYRERMYSKWIKGEIAVQIDKVIMDPNNPEHQELVKAKFMPKQKSAQYIQK